jgi:hypothetical protein
MFTKLPTVDEGFGFGLYYMLCTPVAFPVLKMHCGGLFCIYHAPPISVVAEVAAWTRAMPAMNH